MPIRQSICKSPIHNSAIDNFQSRIHNQRSATINLQSSIAMSSTQRDSSKSPRFAQPATFMRLPHQTDLTGVDAAILGVPFDSGTSYRSGARLGRARSARSPRSSARTRTFRRSRRSTADDRRRRRRRRAAGRHRARPTPRSKRGRRSHPRRRRGRRSIVGGDHSISLPVLRAVARGHGPLALVQFDAHIDTWGDYFGGKYFHGSPFRRAIEEGLIRAGAVRAGRHPRPDVRGGG